MEQNNSSTHGIDFCGVLQVALIVLKLCKVISWRWVWVMAPSWIALAIYFIVLVVGIVIAAGDDDCRHIN